MSSLRNVLVRAVPTFLLRLTKGEYELIFRMRDAKDAADLRARVLDWMDGASSDTSHSVIDLVDTSDSEPESLQSSSLNEDGESDGVDISPRAISIDEEPSPDRIKKFVYSTQGRFINKIIFNIFYFFIVIFIKFHFYTD